MGANASKIVAKYGHLKIIGIEIYRRPIMDSVMNLMNAFTLGEAKQRLKESPYDKLYHLGCYATLENNEVLEVDKQQTIKIRKLLKKNPNNEYMNVNIKKEIPFGESIANTIKQMGDKRFFEYDARNSNCQDFMINYLNANGLGTTENNNL
jgi:hypothetical protein